MGAGVQIISYVSVGWTGVGWGCVGGRGGGEMGEAGGEGALGNKLVLYVHVLRKAGGVRGVSYLKGTYSCDCDVTSGRPGIPRYWNDAKRFMYFCGCLCTCYSHQATFLVSELQWRHTLHIGPLASTQRSREHAYNALAA